jgi:hypothetical protein
MTTIAVSTGLVTTINVFVVKPSNQQKLLDILASATETAVRDMPGFIAAALQSQSRRNESLGVSLCPVNLP